MFAELLLGLFKTRRSLCAPLCFGKSQRPACDNQSNLLISRNKSATIVVGARRMQSQFWNQKNETLAKTARLEYFVLLSRTGAGV